MKTIRMLIVLMTLFILPTFFCHLAFADDAALKNLKTVRLIINVPADSGYLYSRIRNMVELKLRQAGLSISDNAIAELRLNIIWMDIDANRQIIKGKYGTVELFLMESVFPLRNAKIMTTARTWESFVSYLHGPPDDFADRVKESASDIVDDFLNSWLKAK